MTDEKTYTHLHMEACACLWEAMLDARDTHVTLNVAWDTYGTVEMRHDAIAMSDFLLLTWAAMTADEQYALAPYDWDFVPKFLWKLEWVSNGGVLHPTDPRAMADLIINGEALS